MPLPPFFILIVRSRMYYPKCLNIFVMHPSSIIKLRYAQFFLLVMNILKRNVKLNAESNHFNYSKTKNQDGDCNINAKYYKINALRNTCLNYESNRVTKRHEKSKDWTQLLPCTKWRRRIYDL